MNWKYCHCYHTVVFLSFDFLNVMFQRNRVIETCDHSSHENKFLSHCIYLLDNLKLKCTLKSKAVMNINVKVIKHVYYHLNIIQCLVRYYLLMMGFFFLFPTLPVLLFRQLYCHTIILCFLSPFDPKEWLTTNFSLHYNPWISTNQRSSWLLNKFSSSVP